MQKELHLPITLIENKNIVSNYYVASFKYDGEEPKPGQFVNIEVKPFLLKRPFAIFDYEKNVLSILYRVVGKGTEVISKWPKGVETNVLSPLGKSFSLEDENPVLIGGGTGIASLLFLAKKLKNKPTILLGLNNEAEAKAFSKLFSDCDADLHLSTMDGSFGFKGNVIEMAEDLLKDKKSTFYACGPHVMLEALNNSINEKKTLNAIKSWVSLEGRMGCGFGVCLGCAVKKVDSSNFAYVCKDGPVFDMKEIDFNVC